LASVANVMVSTNADNHARFLSFIYFLSRRKNVSPKPALTDSASISVHSISLLVHFFRIKGELDLRQLIRHASAF
jgi:hypothetical protein